MYSRTLNIVELLKKKSLFLFGPRSTGKSTLIKSTLLTDPNDRVRYYDLLDADVYGRLLRDPKILESENSKNKPWVVIDEIQNLPSILNEVHRLIEKYSLRFLLTGSSARKLRHGGANLLAGRAWEANLFGLTSREIPDFDLLTYLHSGGLPHIYGSSDWQEELYSYINLYLQEEIKAEALVRNIGQFARFLDIIGLNNGQELSYENIASDCGVQARTVQNYVGILEDTLIGFALEPYLSTKKRKAITRRKFYLFDVGVAGMLAKRGNFLPKSKDYGDAFEHFIVGEIRSYLSYSRKRLAMQYWRSTSKYEVDCILGNEVAIEIKTSDFITDKHLRGLRAFKEEGLVKKYCIVSHDPEPRITHDNIQIYPWQRFLNELWNHQIISPSIRMDISEVLI